LEFLLDHLLHHRAVLRARIQAGDHPATAEQHCRGRFPQRDVEHVARPDQQCPCLAFAQPFGQAERLFEGCDALAGLGVEFNQRDPVSGIILPTDPVDLPRRWPRRAERGATCQHACEQGGQQDGQRPAHSGAGRRCVALHAAWAF